MPFEGLLAILGPDRLLTGEAISRTYDCDAYTVDRSAPMAVALPINTAEVAEIIRWCGENQMPFTPRGAGTGLSGGSLAAMGGVVISTKRMTEVLEIDLLNRRMKAQAGAVNLKLSQAVREHGLHFAPDPSSQSVSTLGGNIAENSGGPHTLKYGVTAPHILGLTMVDETGEVRELGGGADDTPGIDWTQLVVGSEGTFCIVTEAWIKLTPLPESVQTALAAFTSPRHATEAVSAIIAEGMIPAALEMMDRGILGALKAAFGLDYPAGADSLLLVECDGSPHTAQLEIQRVEEICRASGAIEVRIAQDEVERAQLWTARKKGVGAMGRIAPTLVTHDGVIPRSKLPEMLDFVYAVADQHGLKVANLFHAGDGNLHPIFCFDDREPGIVARVVEAGDQIIRKCVEFGGSVTGEHGIGVEKLDGMKLMFSEDDLDFQRDIQSIFVSGDLCNPCKVIPSQKGCVEHSRRWRGAAT